MNLPTLSKKGLVSQIAKPKFAKKGDDSSETCSDIVPYKEDLPPIGNIVLESSPPLSTRTYSPRHSTTTRSRPPILKPSVDAPFSRTRGRRRKTSPPVSFATVERIVCYL